MKKVNTNLAVRDLAYCALFVVLLTVGAFLKIPIPYLPITFQTTFAIMAGLLLGAKLGSLSILVYIIMGLCGMPVFTSGGGFGYVLQPSFGYLIGFYFGAIVCGYLSKKLKAKGYLGQFIAGICGCAVVYLIGVPYLILILKFYVNSSMPISKMLVTYFLLLFPKDVILIALAAILTKRLKPFVKVGDYRRKIVDENAEQESFS